MGVLELIRQFKEEALNKTMVSFNMLTLLQRVEESIHTGSPCGIVALEEDKIVGLITGLILTSYFDETQIMALELMWYVDKNYRGKSYGKDLIKAFEEYAKLKGARTVTMIAGHYSIETSKDRELDIFYRRNKYKKLETHYIKGV